jgi:hypothetical protein
MKHRDVEASSVLPTFDERNVLQTLDFDYELAKAVVFAYFKLEISGQEPLLDDGDPLFANCRDEWWRNGVHGICAGKRANAGLVAR